MPCLARLCAAAALVAAAAPVAPAAARGRDGGGDRGEVRVAGSCGNGARAKLRLKAEDGRIEVEFEVDRGRAGESWRVVLSREGRVVVRTRARTSGRSGSFTVERRLTDLRGADRVVARAVGPRGLTCAAAATLRA